MSQKRTNKITLAFTESQWRKIQKAARLEGESESEFLEDWAKIAARGAIDYAWSEAERGQEGSGDPQIETHRSRLQQERKFPRCLVTIAVFTIREMLRSASA